MDGTGRYPFAEANRFVIYKVSFKRMLAKEQFAELI
jgi:hypothetical protein